jgi:hypothetical protein
MSQDPVPWWLSWVVPVLALVGAVSALVRRVFTHAVRAEMRGMHQENQTVMLEMGNRLNDVETTLARIEGRMQERWGDYGQHER